MSSASTLPIGIHRANANGFFSVPDPLASGTISYSNKGIARCRVTTLGVESRALPAAASQAVGNILYVYLKTAAGVLTITGAASSVVLTNTGDVAVFEVVDNAGTNAWRCLLSTANNPALALEKVTKTAKGDSASANPLTAAEVLTRWIEGTPTADAVYTLPTATNMAAGIAGAKVGDSFIVTVNNVSAGNFKITMTTNTGWTTVGDLVISPGQSRAFRISLLSTTTAEFAAVGSSAVGTFGNKSVATISITTNPLLVSSVMGGTIISAPGGAISLTWPTAALLSAAFPNGAAQPGDAVDVVVTVTTAQTVTFLTNTGVTLTGASPAITGTTVGVSRLFRLTFTATGAYTVS